MASTHAHDEFVQMVSEYARRVREMEEKKRLAELLEEERRREAAASSSKVVAKEDTWEAVE